jgi:hypothetical protein
MVKIRACHIPADAPVAGVLPNEDCFAAAGFFCCKVKDTGVGFLNPLDLHGVFFGEEELLCKSFLLRGFTSYATMEPVAWHKWERAAAGSDYVRRGELAADERRGLREVLEWGGEQGREWRERVGRGKEADVALRRLMRVGVGDSPRSSAPVTEGAGVDRVGMEEEEKDEGDDGDWEDDVD